MPQDLLVAHFKTKDPRIAPLFSQITLDPILPSLPHEYFVRLCESIIGQQLSTTVADVIFSRFKKLFPDGVISEEKVAALSFDQLRGIGMSGSKARFIQDLARQLVEKTVDLSKLHELSDEEVVTELIKVKGIGPWTAEMFLIFTLGREDVFSYGDLGLKKAMQKLYDFKKIPTPKQMERLVMKWKPYRSHAARILWRYLDQ